jgi:hypothetical protein
MKPLFLMVLLASCESQNRQQPVSFPVLGSDQALFGVGRDAAEGKLDFSRTAVLEYQFAAVPQVSHPASFEIAYTLQAAGGMDVRPVLEFAGTLWTLPTSDSSGSFSADVFHYAVPVGDSVPLQFSVALESDGRDAGSNQARLQIYSVSFKDRWYGFRNDGSDLHISPFVSRYVSDSAWAIDIHAATTPPLPGIPDGLFPVISADFLPGRQAVLDVGPRRFVASAQTERLRIPSALVDLDERPLILQGDRATSFRVEYVQIPRFPVPIVSDPGMILSLPQERWRNSRYEVFRWDRFPSVLIFDMANYAVQDSMLKRLAFFVEKQGFEGKLVSDREMANLHGWNAHDYRAEALARFFQAANKENFPLLAEERELGQILLSEGIIKDVGGSIQAGEGAILSISRESSESLRQTFMAHEGFHGLFYVDSDFRAFSRRRWEQLPQGAKRFLVSYFSYMGYNPADEYLMIKEFNGYVLQQPVSSAAWYFGTALPSRLETIAARRGDLPAKDRATNSWPSLAVAFANEAQAFSDFVYRRWGLTAGNVGSVTIQPRP